MGSNWGHGRKGLAGVAVLAASIAVLASAPAAQAAPSWHSGAVERSYIQNCISYSFPVPITEEGAWTWTSQYFDEANPPDVNPNATPDANEIFYVSVVAGAVGNACSGQRVHFELMGTPGGGMATAIVPGYPVFCYAINWNNNPATAQQEPTWPAGACPHLPQAPVFNAGAVSFDAQTNPGNPADTDPWPLPQGRGWEIQIPVTSSLTRNGGFCPGDNDCNAFDSWIIDGNSSPQLFPRFGLFVDSATAGGGSGNPGDGGTDDTAPPLKPAPTPPRPAAPATTTAPAQAKCKKGQKLKKGKCVKKKKKKKKR